MDKHEALEFVGKRVSAWTEMNGTYVGTLREVLTRPRAPWRGVVEIEATLTAAFSNFPSVRRGMRPGERIEVGGTNIEPTEAAGVPYADAIRHALAEAEGHYRAMAGRIVAGKGERYDWATPPMVLGNRAALVREWHRLQTGDWSRDLVPTDLPKCGSCYHYHLGNAGDESLPADLCGFCGCTENA